MNKASAPQRKLLAQQNEVVSINSVPKKVKMLNHIADDFGLKQSECDIYSKCL